MQCKVMLGAKSDYPKTPSLSKMFPLPVFVLKKMDALFKLSVQHEKSNQRSHYVQFHSLKAYSRKRSTRHSCRCLLLRSLQSRNRPNPTCHQHHHPNQTTAKMSGIKRLLKQKTWFKWMQFQHKSIIHSTAITDSLFIDIVQFDVYCKIRF